VAARQSIFSFPCGRRYRTPALFLPPFSPRPGVQGRSSSHPPFPGIAASSLLSHLKGDDDDRAPMSRRPPPFLFLVWRVEEESNSFLPFLSASWESSRSRRAPFDLFGLSRGPSRSLFFFFLQWGVGLARVPSFPSHVKADDLSLPPRTGHRAPWRSPPSLETEILFPFFFSPFSLPRPTEPGRPVSVTFLPFPPLVIRRPPSSPGGSPPPPLFFLQRSQVLLFSRVARRRERSLPYKLSLPIQNRVGAPLLPFPR